MKYTMLKIGVFAACCIGGNTTYSQELSSKASIKKLLERSCFFASQEVHAIKKNVHCAPMIGLSNYQALNTHHYGLRFLKNDYQIPKELDQIRAIRSHFSYLGKSSYPLTRSEIVTQLEKSSHSFFIFEMEIQKQPHFYLVHPQGTRHFTSIRSHMQNGEMIASLKNGDGSYYPDLSCFFRSTFANYI